MKKKEKKKQRGEINIGVLYVKKNFSRGKRRRLLAGLACWLAGLGS